MTHLDVPGASLYYETIGHGPMLLCISGSTGSVEPWPALAQYLKDHYTVVMYDRRGFSRSYLIGAQDYDHRLETDADDAAHIIKHLSPNGPATVLCYSSGSLVGLELLIRHPDLIYNLMAHEPPAHKMLPECDQIAQGTQQIYNLYRKAGMAPALEMFAKAVGLSEMEAGALMESFNPKNGPYVHANAMYWMEREVLTYPNHDFDVEALRKNKDMLVLACGADSNKEAAHYQTNVVLAEKLGLELVLMPGGHLGFASHSEQFAEKWRTI